MTEILLGFEVTEPYKVAHLPLHHTGFTGMTQKAGKTTGIEAVAMRSGRQAITFRTKRGEVGFETTGTLIEPFFLERSDWQYVESLIEATMRENQRFNRSWIIRACEGTKDDLNKVWENIKEAKKTARGLALSVYTNLDAYFKLVVPQIRKYKFSKTLDLAETGVSVMNLIGMSREVQALVIRSAIDHVLQHLENVIVVIPEAWKFIGVVHTPVTYGAEQLIREGASVGNYLFIDSQDISGINSKIRGQIDNWILGRQKYEHEIDRTLKAIPIKNKPSKEEVQTLQLGHFFAACDVWVKKIYFLPWGISEEIGLEVAKGIRTPQTVKKMLEEKRKKLREDDDLVWKVRFEELKKAHDSLLTVKEGLEQRLEKVEKEFAKQVEHLSDLKAKEKVKAFRDRIIQLTEEKIDAEKLQKHNKLLEIKVTMLTEQCRKAEEDLKVFDDFKSVMRRMLPQQRQPGFEPGVEGPSKVSVTVEQPALILKKKTEPLELSQEDLIGRIAIVYAEGLLPEKAFSLRQLLMIMEQRFGHKEAYPNLSKPLTELVAWGYLEKVKAGTRWDYRVKLSPKEARDKGLLKEG